MNAAKMLNLITADICFVAYVWYGAKTGEWRRGWYIAVLFILNLWAAVWL